MYQIYGNHPVYGTNSLLYIGKANKELFSQRLKERWDFKETVLTSTWLHIGMLYESEDCKYENWGEMIDIAEKILIKAHAPSYNASDVKGLLYKFDKTIVMNWGEYGALLPEVSSMRTSYDYWDNVNAILEEKK